MHASFTPQEALALEQRVRGQVDRDRHRSTAATVPLALFGGLSLLAAAIAASGSLPAYGVFWAVAGPAGGAALAWWFRRADLELQVARPPAATMVLIAAALVAGTLAAGWAADGSAAFFVVGAGYLLFATVTANRTTAAVALAILVASTVSVAVGRATATDEVARTALLTATVGAVQLLGAWREHRRTGRAAG